MTQAANAKKSAPGILESFESENRSYFNFHFFRLSTCFRRAVKVNERFRYKIDCSCCFASPPTSAPKTRKIYSKPSSRTLWLLRLSRPKETWWPLWLASAIKRVRPNNRIPNSRESNSHMFFFSSSYFFFFVPRDVFSGYAALWGPPRFRVAVASVKVVSTIAIDRYLYPN